MTSDPLQRLLVDVEARLAAAQDDVARRNALERALDDAEDALQSDYLSHHSPAPSEGIRTAAYCEVSCHLRAVRENAGIPPSLEAEVPQASRPDFHAEEARLAAIVEDRLEHVDEVPASSSFVPSLVISP